MSTANSRPTWCVLKDIQRDRMSEAFTFLISENISTLRKNDVPWAVVEKVKVRAEVCKLHYTRIKIEFRLVGTVVWDEAVYFRRYTVLWHVDPLLGNDLEISSYTIAVAKWWFCKQRQLLSNGCNRHTQQYKSCWKRCSECGPCRGYIMRTSFH
jgi:hypothetical protein